MRGRYKIHGNGNVFFSTTGGDFSMRGRYKIHGNGNVFFSTTGGDFARADKVVALHHYH